MTPEAHQMTPEAQRIAIAEACGWTRSTDPERTRGRYEWVVLNPDGFEVFWSDKGTYRQALPSYLSDLNAMHEAEKVLTNEQRSQVMDALCEIVRRDHNPEAGPMTAIIAAFFATAAQRAEAFLRTLNLWHP